MIDLFMPIRSFFKYENVCTDNNVFRMHYKITVTMLLVFTLMVTSKQFFGEPIHCMGDSSSHDKDAVNSYCWIYGTFTMKKRLNGIQGKTMAYPGVGPQEKDDVVYKHRYYQWVCFVLLGQAAMFYVPRYLWKIWEGGRLKVLAADLACPLRKKWTESRRDDLLAYLSYGNLHTHNMYALRYAFCELLNLCNVVGQIFLIDLFLGGAFRDYGAAIIAFTQTATRDVNSSIYVNTSPVDQFFPKLTKCTLYMYGPSGGLNTLDKLCVLPLNIVNEKIFAVLWFWLIILSILSAFAVVFRILVFSLRPLRALLTLGQMRYMKQNVVRRIVNRLSFGDWFILNMLGKNMNPQVYKELVMELSKHLDNDTMKV